MFFSPFLAIRYLTPKRTFMSIITVISILGVALGVWAMIVVISVFTGYGERIKESILGFEPHIVIDNGSIMKDWFDLCEEVKKVKGIEAVTPFVRGQVVMDFRGLRSAPLVRGILPPEGKELERMRSKLAKQPDPAVPNKMITKGEFDVSDPYSCVIGDGIAEGQGINVGDTVLLYSPRDIAAIMKSLDEVEGAKDEKDRKAGLNEIRQMTAPQEVTVKGIFNSGNWDVDSNVIFTNLETAQVLYNFGLDECHGIALRTKDAFRVDQYRDALYKILPQTYRALTWAEMNKTVFDAVAAERQAMFLILFIIMIVGSFGIMSTMITITVQKRTEIGLLKALGSREHQIAWVFLFQGMLVGLLGVICGFLIAELTLHFRNEMSAWIGQVFHVDIFAAEIYKVDGGLPAKQTPRDLSIIMASAFTCCTLAALIPALIAAFLQPAKALRSQ